MGHVVVSTVIEAPADAVWDRISDFTSWHTWIPRIVATQMDPGQEAGGVGAVRTLTLSDDSTVRERLVAKNIDTQTIAYDFPGGSPFPVRTYLATIRVDPITTTGTTFVHWSSDFDADEAVEAATAGTFSRIYSSFLRNLADSLLGVSSTA